MVTGFDFFILFIIQIFYKVTRQKNIDKRFLETFLFR